MSVASSQLHQVQSMSKGNPKSFSKEDIGQVQSYKNAFDSLFKTYISKLPQNQYEEDEGEGHSEEQQGEEEVQGYDFQSETKEQKTSTRKGKGQIRGKGSKRSSGGNKKGKKLKDPQQSNTFLNAFSSLKSKMGEKTNKKTKEVKVGQKNKKDKKNMRKQSQSSLLESDDDIQGINTNSKKVQLKNKIRDKKFDLKPVNFTIKIQCNVLNQQPQQIPPEDDDIVLHKSNPKKGNGNSDKHPITLDKVFNYQQSEESDNIQQTIHPQQTAKKTQEKKAKGKQKQSIRKFDKQEQFLGSRINTLELSLAELMNELWLHRIITKKFLNQFLKKHCQEDIFKFLQHFELGILPEFDFKSCKVTIMDHRRITELLCNLFPEKYYLGPLKQPNQRIYQFLQNLYQLKGGEYFQLFSKIDQTSQLRWWKKIMMIQQQNLLVKDKERRMAKRKSDKIISAIDEIIENKKVEAIDLQKDQEDDVVFIEKEFQPKPVKKGGRKPKHVEDEQISRIRQMVSQFGNSNPLATESKPDQANRKKVVFY